MKEVRNEAFKLRLRGYSYNEINKALGVPKSTLSGWFSGLVLSKSAQKRLERRKSIGSATLIKRNKLQTLVAQQRAAQMQNKGKNKIKELNTQELLLIGISLYWGEGYKKLAVRNGRELTSHNISFTNADPEMIRVFIRFLIEVLDINPNKILIDVRLYPHMNKNKTLEYWLRVSGLSEENMGKPTYHVSVASKRRLPYNRLPYGTARVQVNDTKKFHYLLGMIEGVKGKL